MSNTIEDNEDRLQNLFDKFDDEYIEFDNIPEDQRRHTRPDLCAMIYLQEKLGGTGDVIGGAEHDEIFLDFNDIEKLTEEDVLYIARCGVRYNEGGLAMLV